MIETFLIFVIFLIAVTGFGLLIYQLTKISERLNQQSQINFQQSGEIQKIKEVMENQLKEIRGTVDGSSRLMMNQVRSFTRETTELKKDLRNIQEKVGDISSFQEIFRSPKLRGQWGEASLEHILSQHFPSELYQKQYLFPSGEQVDAVLRLPNNKILPIDAKFSSENFEKMIQAKPEEKAVYSQKFINDIKRRIKEISSKYIRPSEGTVDFALMYIPAEAIYYEIMFNLTEEDLARYAWKQKVALTSPNTIYLTLRTIEHWFRDTQISKRTQQILKRLERINRDAQNLSEEFRKLGRHLKDASSAYDRSERRLSLLDERVKTLIEARDKKQLKSGSPPLPNDN